MSMNRDDIAKVTAMLQLSAETAASIMKDDEFKDRFMMEDGKINLYAMMMAASVPYLRVAVEAIDRATDECLPFQTDASDLVEIANFAVAETIMETYNVDVEACPCGSPTCGRKGTIHGFMIAFRALTPMAKRALYDGMPEKFKEKVNAKLTYMELSQLQVEELPDLEESEIIPEKLN